MDAVKCPASAEHGAVAERKAVTPEQQWCGQWWDCTRCTSSVLLMSDALKASHAAKASAPHHEAAVAERDNRGRIYPSRRLGRRGGR